MQNRISKQKLVIFRKFYGDADGLTRVGSNADKKVMSAEDWQ